MWSRRFVAVGAVLSAFALVLSGGASATPTAKGPPAARHTREIRGLIDAISCASRSLCVGFGTVPQKGYVVDTITADGTKVHAHTSMTTGTVAVSCPSAAGCALIEQKPPSYTDVIALVNKNGTQSKPIGLGAAASSQLNQIACHPTRTHCTLVGGNGSQIYIVVLNGTTATGSTVTLPAGQEVSGIGGLSCPTASQCYAAGAISVGAKLRGFVVSIKIGVANGRLLVPSASYEGLVSISCATATSCAAIGYSQRYSYAYVLHNGKLSHTAKAPKRVTLFGVACETAHLCEVAADKQQKTGNPKGAIVPMRNGKLGKPQVSSVTTEYFGGSTEGTAVITAFHGGIAAIGPDLKREKDTILSIS
jgi:hypothetical protein